MGKLFEQLDDSLVEFIESQKVFFVATAPLAGDGRVNLSPKGLDCLHVLDPLTVAYLDLTGSGIETVAHLRENGRIVFMFCAFEGRPRILRLHGVGEAFECGDPAYEALRPDFPEIPGARAIIRVRLQRISDSCGWGVPLYDFKQDRSQLPRFAESLGAERLQEEQRKENSESIDGLPGLLLRDGPH